MSKELKRFTLKELCSVGFGYKYHIRGRGQLTLCGNGPMDDLYTAIISVREDWKELCQNCVREFQKGGRNNDSI